jgi:hypothetical protein
MNKQQQAAQYQKQQKESDQQKLLEKSEGLPFINGLLKHIFGSAKS